VAKLIENIESADHLALNVANFDWNQYVIRFVNLLFSTK
jgi:hypothetical protein